MSITQEYTVPDRTVLDRQTLEAVLAILEADGQAIKQAADSRCFPVFLMAVKAATERLSQIVELLRDELAGSSLYLRTTQGEKHHGTEA